MESFGTLYYIPKRVHIMEACALLRPSEQVHIADRTEITQGLIRRTHRNKTFVSNIISIYLYTTAYL